MEVYSQDKSGKQTIAKILKTSSVKAPLTHKVVHLSLKDGRNAYISPNHPTISGVTVGELKAGDSYDGSVVKSAELVPYTRGRTYDLLPEGETGFYYADGVLMASTLKGSVKGLTANAQNTESSCREDAQCAEGFYCKSRTRCRTLPDGTAQCTNVIGGDCYPKPSEGECAQVITRACSNTAPQVCRDFPTPCDVPDGWVVPGLNSRNSNYFIVDWVQKSFDNGAGTITLNGKSQGTKTNLTPLTMVTIKFKAKKAGTGTISFGDSTQILRLSDSQNILQTKRNLEFTVAGATPSASVIGDPCGPGGIAPCPSASASPLAGTCHTTPDCSANQYCQYVEAECSVGNCPRYGYCVANNGGKGDANNDGFIDLADLSILYSSFLKNVAKLDFNNDNKINSIDFGYMILLLRSLRVIN